MFLGKEIYANLPSIMTSVAQKEIGELPASIQEGSVLYLPQLGYLLAIPRIDSSDNESGTNIEGLEFMFLSETIAHYKSQRMRELDATLVSISWYLHSAFQLASSCYAAPEFCPIV